MCTEKRGLFQVIDMTGDSPKTKYSFNPTAIQFWGWACAKMAALIVGLWIAVSFIAGYTFTENLTLFHDKAKPAIEKLIDEKIFLHEAIAPTTERIHVIEAQQMVIQEQVKTLDETVKANGETLDKMDDKLDRLLERPQ